MLFEAAGVLLVGTLVAVFAASAIAKIVYRQETYAWFGQLFPRLPQARVTVVVVLAEASIIVGLIAVPRAGAVAAASWLVMANAVLVAARRRVATCACFGVAQRLGPMVAVRNGLMLTAALVAVVVQFPAHGLVIRALWVGVALAIAAGLLWELRLPAHRKRGLTTDEGAISPRG